MIHEMLKATSNMTSLKYLSLIISMIYLPLKAQNASEIITGCQEEQGRNVCSYATVQKQITKKR